MAIQKSLFSGGTNYLGATIDDIVSELTSLKKMTEETIENLKKIEKHIKDNSAKFTYSKQIKSFINFRIAKLRCYACDLQRLIKELPNKVADAHCEILKQMARSIDSEQHLCHSFKVDYAWHSSEKQENHVIDKVYSEARGLLMDYLDISGIRQRLYTFIGVKTVSDRKTKKKKVGTQNNTVSKLDSSKWTCPTKTYFLLKFESGGGRTQPKFYIIWKGTSPVTLPFKNGSQMHSLFNLFVTNRDAVNRDEMKRILETKQSPSKAVRDLNKALVSMLRRKLRGKCNIPDLVIGNSNKRNGYRSLIPVVTPEEIDRLELSIENNNCKKSEPKFFSDGFQTKKRGNK